MSVTGVAQTNERVSEFLRNTAKPLALAGAPRTGWEIKSLTQNGANRESLRLFDFNVKLTLKRPQDQAASAPAPAAAASAAKHGA